MAFQKGHKFISGAEKGWFKKGISSWNRNTVLSKETIKKMVETRMKNGSYIAWNSGTIGIMKPNQTSFKKGQKPHNYKGGISTGENKKEYNRFMTARRYCRKTGNGGSHTLDEWQELKKQYNYMCLCCKQQEPFIKLSEDHIVPLSIGGNDNIENIQPLCKSCNCKKYNKFVDYRVNQILKI